MQEFGDMIREARTALKLSQAELAKAVGLSRQQVNRIENGSTGTEPETAEKLARALKLDVEEARYRAGFSAKPQLTPGEEISLLIQRMSAEKQKMAVKVLEALATA